VNLHFLIGARSLHHFLRRLRYAIASYRDWAHQRIDFVIPLSSSPGLGPSLTNSDMSHRLNLSPGEGEKWIVNLNLIRDTRMASDAKIDLEKVSFSLIIVSSN